MWIEEEERRPKLHVALSLRRRPQHQQHHGSCPISVFCFPRILASGGSGSVHGQVSHNGHGLRQEIRLKTVSYDAIIIHANFPREKFRLIEIPRYMHMGEISPVFEFQL